MAVSDFLGDLGLNIGGVGDKIFGVASTIVYFLIIVVITVIITYIYTSKKSYNKTIVKFETVEGITRRIGTERAREVIISGTSIRAFLLEKSKVFLPRPSIQTGINEYWYFIRDDGEWVNVGLENVNEKLKKMGLKLDHSDMRIANAALKKLIEKNYKKTAWLKEWAPYIGFGILILMLGIAGYMTIGEAGKVNSGLAKAVENMAELTKEMGRLLSSVDNIKSTSGIRPA